MTEDMRQFIPVVRSAMAASGITAFPFQEAYIEYVFYRPNFRRRDLDNLHGQAKTWTDCLVAAGLIVDDDWVHCPDQRQLAVGRANDPGTQLTVVRLR